MQLNLGKAIAFFDLETTGINVSVDRIVEIGVLKIYPDGREEMLEQRINPLIPIPKVTSEIHGIYDADVRLMPTFKEFAPELAQFIGNADLAGYNSNRFDVPLLIEEFLRNGVDFDLRNRRMIDVQNIFMKMEQRTLSAAHQFYLKKPMENAHNAMADVKATYEVFKAQLDRYNDVEFTEKNGVVSKPIVNDMGALAEFSSFHRIADLMGQIIINEDGDELFNFGKFKGKKVKDVLDSEPNYYDWMMKSDFPLYTKKVLTTIKLRDFNSGSNKIV